MPSNVEEEQAQWTWWILRIWGIEIAEMVLSFPEPQNIWGFLGYIRCKLDRNVMHTIEN